MLHGTGGQYQQPRHPRPSRRRQRRRGRHPLPLFSVVAGRGRERRRIRQSNDDGNGNGSDNDNEVDNGVDGADTNSAAKQSHKCYEAKYEEGATELFQLIESQKWEEALRLLEEEPDEAKIWVVSSGTENTVFSWSVWRRLPIHEVSCCLLLSCF